jgi:hypothetical protein
VEADALERAEVGDERVAPVVGDLDQEDAGELARQASQLAPWALMGAERAETKPGRSSPTQVSVNVAMAQPRRWPSAGDGPSASWAERA